MAMVIVVATAIMVCRHGASWIHAAAVQVGSRQPPQIQVVFCKAVQRCGLQLAATQSKAANCTALSATHAALI